LIVFESIATDTEALQRKAELFEDFKAIEQLRCGGVIEAVRMCRESYPSRYPHEEFITTFSTICPEVPDP
jgi:myosin-5